MSLCIADRFGWDLEYIRSLSIEDFWAALAYIKRHPVNRYEHYLVAKSTMMMCASAGAKFNNFNPFKELDYHDEVPEYLLSTEEIEERKQAMIQKAKEDFYKNNSSIIE